MRRLGPARGVRGGIALLAALYAVTAAVADVPAPPVRQTVDSNGVDLVRGTYNSNPTDVTIGPAGLHGLAYTRYWAGHGWRHSLIVTMSGSGLTPTVSIAGSSETFTRVAVTSTGSTYTADLANGSSLFREPSGDYVYTGRDGTTVRFMPAGGAMLAGYDSELGRARWIKSPDGTIMTFTYKNASYIVYPPGGGTSTVTYARLQSVTNNHGYQLKFTYGTNLLSQGNEAAWKYPTRVTAINNAVEHCDPAADSCTLANAWPHADYGYSAGYSDVNLTSVTDPANRTWQYGYEVDRLNTITRPGASSPDVVIQNYATDSFVSSIQRGGQTWTYGNVLSGWNAVTRTVTMTDPLSRTRVAVSNTVHGQLSSDTDENGHTTDYEYGPAGHVQKVTAPEGNYVTYAYDARGNRTSTVATPKPGSSLPAMAAYATYPGSCASALTCNKPVTTTDEAGNVTNYYYNADGSLDYFEAPAPSVGAPRPRTRYGYGSFYAWTKTSGGSFTTAASPVVLPVKSWTCRATAACVDTSSDAVKTSYAYQSGSYSAGSNLLLSSVTNGSGAGTPSATTSYGYDAVGNLTSVTDPLSQTTQIRFNDARQEIARWTPDPDGAGSSRPRATATHYQADGKIDVVTQGTSNSDGSGFSGLQAAHVGYDSYGRKVTERLNDAGNPSATAAFSLTQYGYDALGRVECVAMRMTPATYGSLPAACVQVSAPGANGPDRIGKTLYDYRGAIDTVQSGVGTALVQNESNFTYTANGRSSSVTDAKGNVTAFAYDGFDRLSRTCFNSTLATCTAGSPSDYVTVAYGASGAGTGKVVTEKLRGDASAAVVSHSYDLLGRATGVDYPGTALTDSDRAYTYDNLGQLLAVTDGNGHSSTFAYDALGRLTSQGDSISSRTIQYDAAGRRTRLTWADGFYVTYDYDVTGRMTAIRENGSTALATFEYDDLARRTKLTRGNGVVSTYGHNNASQLSALGLDLAGTANDQNYTYSYNPAAQITQRTQSNDSYDWNGHYNVSRNYTSNGLNQYTATGAVVPTYDAKGNVTSAGPVTYTYNSKNELVQASDTGKQFYFDPTGRLDSILSSSGAALRAFQYDGANIVTEVSPASGNAVARRYVWGPEVDEPLVWYEGSGTGDKRYLAADERGSVVAVTDVSGNALAINRYDEFGIPAPTNLGQFQYTGQAWLPELGMYHYKARSYSPTLGRFLQTDPIGYDDGLNWYNYVGDDPINGRDPSGTASDMATGTNIPGAFGCPSCSDWGVFSVTGDSSEREKGDRAQNPSGLAGTYYDLVKFDGLHNEISRSTILFIPDSLFAIPAGLGAGPGGGGEGRSGGVRLSRDRILVGTAERAANSIPKFFHSLLGRAAFGWLRGILIHSKFASMIRAMNSPIYHAEVSYLRGRVVPYGTPGSIRADAVVGNPAAPLFAIELKTGLAFITPNERAAYNANLPPTTLLQAIIIP